MNTGGWIIMLSSVGFVTVLFGWCIWKVLTTPGEADRLHSPADIQSPDALRE
jgi:hypothetical protein